MAQDCFALVLTWGREHLENAFPVGPLLTGTRFEDDTVTITLPPNSSLDDFDSLSVWCIDFAVNFGDLQFAP